MTMIAEDKLVEKLSKCKNLFDADTLLPATMATRAECWGLFDGWAGRPHTTSGLVAETSKNTTQARLLESEYDAAHETGAKLGKKHNPNRWR